jgi:LisH domain-containing protein ARMC9
LDTKGSDLSKTSEFLAYYALPYIPNPMQHPSFQSLFTIQWVADLKAKIKAFIHGHA